MPGTRDPAKVDADLNYGVSNSYGYSSDSCVQITKQEMITRELISCTFSPLAGESMDRCNANQSVSYYRSFLDTNNMATPDIQVYSIDSKAGLRTRYNKPCLPDCVQEWYVTFTSYFTLSYFRGFKPK